MYIYICISHNICIYIYIYIYIPYVYTYTYASPGSMAIVGMKLAARVSCILTKTPVANVPSSVLRLRPSTKNNFVGSLKSNHPKRYKKNRQRTCFLVEFYFFYLFGVVANLLSNPGWNGFWYLWWMCCPMKPSQSNTHHPRPWGVDLAPYVLTDQFPMCTQIDSLVHSTFGIGVGRGGAREDKGRIYQPQPFFNFIIGTQPLLQPLLDFLRLTITLQPWGVGWAGVGLGKIRVGSTSHNLSSTSL